MRKLTLLFALICSQFAVAQFDLEHTYEDVSASRIKFGINGEKYYQFDKQARSVILYNSDHTLWKTISLPAPETLTNLRFWFASDDVFNNDDKIEIAYSYQFPETNGSFTEGKIINEDGDVLINITDALYFELMRIEGLDDKIEVGMPDNDYRIYSAALSLEHTYTGNPRRIKLENSGEKYFYSFNDQARLYNADHTLWKTVALAHPAGSYIRNVSLLSEAINADGLLKIGYNYQTQLPDFTLLFEGRLINETGQLLLTVPDAAVFTINTNLGLAPKLIVSTEFSVPAPIYGFIATKIYGIPGLQLEHDYYPDSVSRANFETDGEKYFSTSRGANHTDLYNSDHTLWKTINFMHDGQPVDGNIQEISQKTLNDDDLVEVSFNYYSGDGYDAKVVNESGNELLALTSCISITLSRINGVDDKLIAQFYDGAAGTYTGTSVYGFNSLQTIDFSGNTVAIYPNPAADEISIDSKSPIRTLSLYNTNGQRVGFLESAGITQL